jgi:predicted nucleic acid-binding protein
MGAKSGDYIVDASVLIKWVGKEAEDLKQAESLRIAYKNEDADLTVLALTFWEIGSYLSRKFDAKTAASVFNHFQNYAFLQAMLTLEEAALAVNIMTKHPGVSFYDASYHALALNKGKVFLTADKKYYEKAKKLGHIQLLRDYR